MNGAHHGADQALDMPAEPRRSRRTIRDDDVVIVTAELEGARVEFGAVVDVNAFGQAACRPFQRYPAVRQPARLVDDRMR